MAPVRSLRAGRASWPRPSPFRQAARPGACPAVVYSRPDLGNLRRVAIQPKGEGSMRKLSVAAVAGTLALVGLAPNAFGQPPEGVPPTERPPAAPPGCAIALEM